MFDVVGIGELITDFTMKGTNSDGFPVIEGHPGGAPLNYLAALSKYGISTAMIGKVGNDTFGKLLIKSANEAGINTDSVIVDENYFTTLAFVTLDEKGDRDFSFARKPGADLGLNFAEVNYDIIEQCKVLHFGTLGFTDEPCSSAVKEAIAFAKSCDKIISFDPNLREPLWKNLSKAREMMIWGLNAADIVKISDYEIDFLWHLSPEEGAKKILNEYEAKLVFVTCGGDGCVYACGNIMGRTVCPKVNVVDTTGAGDIFGGAACSVFLKKGKKFTELTSGDLKEIAEFATVAASLSSEKAGGVMSVPEKLSVDNFLIHNS